VRLNITRRGATETVFGSGGASGASCCAGSGRKSLITSTCTSDKGPDVMEMMHRSVSMPDVQTIRRGDRTLQIGMGAADGAGQIHPPAPKPAATAAESVQPVPWVFGGHLTWRVRRRTVLFVTRRSTHSAPSSNDHLSTEPRARRSRPGPSPVCNIATSVVATGTFQQNRRFGQVGT